MILSLLDFPSPDAHIRTNLKRRNPMFIQTESTPNPATLKFLPGQAVMQSGTADFPTSETASNSPLALRIFAVEGVTAVFFGPDFITVTKEDMIDWNHIKPAVLGAVMEHYQSDEPVMQGEGLAAAGHAEHSGEDAEIVNQIKSYWIHACVLLLHKMVVISPSTALIAGWFIYICKVHVQAAHRLRSR